MISFTSLGLNNEEENDLGNEYARRYWYDGAVISSLFLQVKKHEIATER